MSRSGVLLTAFGGPRTLDEVGPFIATMTGREPSEATVARSREKYERIGGGSPLPEIAERIAVAIEVEIAARAPGVNVRLGMRYASPSIAETLSELVATGVDTVIALSLSPFEAEITTKAYREAVSQAAALAGCAVIEAPGYHLHGGFVESHAAGLRDALRSLEAERPLVVMTAHSLPCDETSRDDTYVRQLRESASAVAVAAALREPSEPSQVGLWTVPMETLWAENSVDAPPWITAYQSRGYRACEWLEPELETVIEAAAGAGFDAVVVAPVGFVTDHMETLYDLDIVAREAASSAGLAYARAAVPNDDPRMIAAFAEVVLSVLPGQEGAS